MEMSFFFRSVYGSHAGPATCNWAVGTEIACSRKWRTLISLQGSLTAEEVPKAKSCSFRADQFSDRIFIALVTKIIAHQLKNKIGGPIGK